MARVPPAIQPAFAMIKPAIIMPCATAVAVTLMANLLGSVLWADEITIVKDRVGRLPIVCGSVQEPIVELQKYLRKMSGAELTIVDSQTADTGVFVGLIRDFPKLKVADAEKLGDEGFVIRSDERNVYLLADEPLGVERAVTTFLQRLGCRWFFPGEVWEDLPSQDTIRGSWNERSSPSFLSHRLIWHGFGDYPPCRSDFEIWCRHNRLGGPLKVNIGHSWGGLNPNREFAEHPDWFALVDGTRKPSKPCYSHPEVIRRGKEAALWHLAKHGTGMVSVTPPDGIGYCECERCLEVLQGATPEVAHGVQFGNRPDGTLVSVPSETVFRYVNEVANAVVEKYPEARVGCYAYSAYSHPPSFPLHPNVYIQTTSAYRRTSLTLEEQLAAFSKCAQHVGIREYFSVYQWDWDYPMPGKMTPAQLQKDLRFYHEHGITGLNAESSNNFAARGLGYYVAAQLLWDIDAELPAFVHDFYRRAFGPAELPMRRYFETWYGTLNSATGEEVVMGKDLLLKNQIQRDVLAAAFRNLDEAAIAVRGLPRYEARVDQLRMYLHYLVLRLRLQDAAATNEPEKILSAIAEETKFGGRLTYTNLLHTRPLLGKAFLRRFRPYEELLANVPDAQQAAKGWRIIGEPPVHEELERLWQSDQTFLQLN